LTGYTLGQTLNDGNLVSFTYSSSYIPNLSMTSGGNMSVCCNSSLPTSLPGPATVVLQQSTGDESWIGFYSETNGSWCAGPNNCEYDGGTGGTWSLAAPGTPTVPVLSAPSVISLALILALMGAILLKRSRKPAGAR
jgi:hypothetical protein